MSTVQTRLQKTHYWQGGSLIVWGGSFPPPPLDRTLACVHAYFVHIETTLHFIKVHPFFTHILFPIITYNRTFLQENMQLVRMSSYIAIICIIMPIIILDDSLLLRMWIYSSLLNNFWGHDPWVISDDISLSLLINVHARNENTQDARRMKSKS